MFKQTKKWLKPALFTALILLLNSTLTACQSIPEQTSNQSTKTPQPSKHFRIFGKIGVTTPATEQQTAQASSAFYAWGQDDDRFAIELTGAFGIGTTQINFDGKTASINSEKTGAITAKTPEELLTQATGWQAPISQLPYWILGQKTPSDNHTQTDDQNRLKIAQNGEWTAHFYYKNLEKYPNKIRIQQPEGYKIIMTIQHSKP